MAILYPHFIILCEKFQIKLDINTKISFHSLVKQRKVIVSWCYGNYCYFALVSWCRHCSVSFQSFVLCHLVIAPVRKAKIAPEKGEVRMQAYHQEIRCMLRFLNSFFFLLNTKITKWCLISPSRMVSFSSLPDDEMYLQQCNQRTVKILVEFWQIN